MSNSSPQSLSCWSARERPGQPWPCNLRSFRIAAFTLFAIVGGAHAGAEATGTAPPPPSIVPPNASRVIAEVQGRKVWPPESLQNARPLGGADQTFYSVQLKIITSEFVSEGLSHLAEAGRTLDTFSAEAIPEGIVGKKIQATITLTGSSEGGRWIIKDFTIVP